MRQPIVDAIRRSTTPAGLSRDGFPKPGRHRQAGGKLDASAVDRDAPHDGKLAVPQRGVLFDIEKDSECASH